MAREREEINTRTSSRGTASRGAASRGSSARTTPAKSGANRGTTSRSSSGGGSGRGKTSQSRPSPGRTTARTSSGKPQSSARAKTQGQGARPRTAASRGPAKKGGYRKTPVNKRTKRLFEWAEAFIEAAVIVFVLFFVFWPLKVEGVSMNPTLGDGDRIIVSRVMSFLNFVDRGDLVVCSVTGEDGKKVETVKRIIGKPEDVVTISGGVVSVNGVVVEEAYADTSMGTYPDTYYYLEASQYFVLGDNRLQSGDSRTFGPIDKDDITAKVLLKFYPLNAIKLF